MLKFLRIQNLSIIREICMEFSSGLTVITGETGAGKSILVDSLGLLMGERAEPDRIRTGERSAAVEAVFDLSQQDSALAILRELGCEPEDAELILRREIFAEGRSRAFIAGRLAPLADLRRVGEALVELHGQHEHQTLLRAAQHLPILDRFGVDPDDLDRMRSLKHELDDVRARLESLSRDQQELARRRDILQFQADEIRAAGVRVGELQALSGERLRARNREKILALARAGVEALYEGDVSVLGVLERALGSARELARFDSEIAACLPRAEDASLALKDLAEAMRAAGGDGEENPGRLDEIESRMALLEGLLRKYGPDEEALVAFGKGCEAELERLSSEENSLEGLQRRERELGGECARQAGMISSQRQESARALEAAVQRELGDLALSGTELRTDFQVDRQPNSPVLKDGEPVALGASGWDRVQFLLRTNRGESFQALSRTASGGEISRIMLALHLALKKGSEGTVRVFDEADAGVGGRVAEAVGRKLRELGRGGQVLCVTHLPQIASMGDHHFCVRKRLRQGRTEASVESLDREGAVREVARMLGGEKVSELTLRHAAEMVARER